jgi:hypothetical protein
MSISRFAMLGLMCLFAGACTVVIQPAADQPEPAPSATEQEADVGVADPEPVRRPPRQQPRRRPTDPDPDPGRYEPESPSRRPLAGENRVNLGIPPGHLPEPGECRVWIQGTPPGRQARSRPCHGILATAPVGSWILYRPAQYQRQVRVRYLHATQRMIIAVRAFDAETGDYLRDFALAEDDNNMGPRAIGGTGPSVRPGGDPRGNRGNSGNDRDRTGTARDRDTNAGNNGVAVGRADTTGNRRSDGNNNGVAVGRGRADTTRGQSSNEGTRGNRGAEERPANAAGKPSNQGRGNSTTASDTSGTRRVAGGDSGIPVRQADAAGNRRTARGNIGVAAGQADTTSITRTGRRDNEVPVVRRSDSTGVAVASTGRGGDVTEEPRGGTPKVRADRRGEPEDTPLRSDVRSSLGINARYLPSAGQCRVWEPGLPFRRQAGPASCDGIADGAPAGAWILRRSTAQPDVIRVDYMDEETAGVVARTSEFDATTGVALRSARPEPR